MKIQSFLFSLLFWLSSSVQAQILKSYSTSSVLEASGVAHQDKFWLNPAGPISKYKGVTGAFGPLGVLGPFGDHFWNASFAFTSIGNWEELARSFTQMSGPLSGAGPLFLTTELSQAMYAFSPAANQLLPGGVLHVVGNAGPLGPLGIAGPLGPNGAHGFSRNKRGDYVSGDEVVKSIKVKTHEGNKTFSLYELYRGDKLEENEILDTSFAVREVVARKGARKFQIHSSKLQWVNVLVVNEFELDSFSLQVEDQHGNRLRSESFSLSNFISVKVRGNTKLTITVTNSASNHLLPGKPFRVFVTGSEGTQEVSRSFHQ